MNKIAYTTITTQLVSTFDMLVKKYGISAVRAEASQFIKEVYNATAIVRRDHTGLAALLDAVPAAWYYRKPAEKFGTIESLMISSGYLDLLRFINGSVAHTYTGVEKATYEYGQAQIERLLNTVPDVLDNLYDNWMDPDSTWHKDYFKDAYNSTALGVKWVDPHFDAWYYESTVRNRHCTGVTSYLWGWQNLIANIVRSAFYNPIKFIRKMKTYAMKSSVFADSRVYRAWKHIFGDLAVNESQGWDKRLYVRLWELVTAWYYALTTTLITLFEAAPEKDETRNLCISFRDVVETWNIWALKQFRSEAPRDVLSEVLVFGYIDQETRDRVQTMIRRLLITSNQQYSSKV